MKTNKPYALNEQGKRQNQEDTVFPAKDAATTDTCFFLVCDGMGGHSHGEVASATVCESFAESLKDTSPEAFDEAAFNRALAYAYDELDRKETSEYGNRMGTTLTFLHLNGCEAFLAHIGDSRIYHLRTSNGKAEIVYKTSDHSLVNELLNAGIITPEEAHNHPKKNVITRAMQPHEEHRPKADVHCTTDVRAGDWFFMCSDGVTESLSDDRLLEIIAEESSPEAKIEAISELCAAYSRDNFSAYLIPVAEGIPDIAEGITDTAGGMTKASDESTESAAITDPPLRTARPATVQPVQRRKSRHRTQKSGLRWWWLILLAAVIAIVGCIYFFYLK